MKISNNLVKFVPILFLLLSDGGFLSSAMASNRCYVGNLSPTTTESTLREVFQSYGHVTDCIVMRDRDTGRSRGFGYVSFSSEMEVEFAINQLNGYELDGRRIIVRKANSLGSGGGVSDGGGSGGGWVN